MQKPRIHKYIFYSPINSPLLCAQPLRICGQIGYALASMIARIVKLGADQPIILHMLDILPVAEALNGVKMELVNAAFPFHKSVIATTDVVEACTAMLVGGFLGEKGWREKM